MADNKKKVYSIVINGLKESVDLVKSLNDELSGLESTIKKIGNVKIKVQGEVSVPKEKKVVSGNETDNNSLVNREKELAIQKQLNAEIKATGHAQAAVTNEYRKSLEEQMKQQEVVKQTKQDVKDMFSGAKTDAGEYTNTLAGLRAELRDLTKEQKSVELGTPEYDKLDDRILSLQSNLKALESAHGDFRRNVGNYPTAEIEAFREKFEQLYGDMQRLVQESNDLQRQLSQKTPGTEEYQALADKLKGVQSELEMAKESVNEFNVSLKGTPTNFEIKVGDTVRNFNSVREAVKTLTKELQVMTFEGKNNTKEFDDTITALGRLKTAIKSTGDELGSYVGNAKGLSDTLEIMQGMTGIAGIGQGLMMLFGGTNEELDETMQKFSGLMLVMQGVEAQYKAFNDTNSIYGTNLKKAWNWLDKIGNWKPVSFIPSLNQMINYLDDASKSAKNYQSALKSIDEWNNGDFGKQWNNVISEINTAAGSADKFSREFKDSFNSIVDTVSRFRISISTAPMEDKLKTIEQYIAVLKQQIESLNALKVDPNISTENLKKVNQLLYDLKSQLHTMEQFKVDIQTGNTEEIFKNLKYDIMEFESHMDELEGKGIDTEQFKNLWEELKNVSQQAQVANANIAQTPKILRTTGVAGQYMAKGMQLAANGVKIVTASIKGLLKSTVILAVVQAAFEAITWIVEKLADAFSALKGPGSMEVDDRLDMIGDAAERASQKIKDYADECDRLAKQGLITELDAEKLKLKEVEKAAIEAAKGLKEYLNRQDEIKAGALSDSLNNSNIWGDASDIKELRKENDQYVGEFVEHYHILEKAVQEGTDKIEAGWKRGTGWLLTAGDAVEQLGDDTKAILGDMQNEINKINFNNPQQAVEQFKKITDNELYQSALANMHKLFPEEEWAKTLDRMYKIFSDRVADMEGRSQDLKTAIISANRELAKQTELSNINAIADTKKRQAALDNYNKKQRQEEIKNSLADEKHKQAALTALDKEYKQKAIERQKSYQKSSTNTTKNGANDTERILKQIRDNHLAIMKEGLDKEIKQLENSMNDELKEAEKATRYRNELILSIQEKYNYLIQRKREEWFKKHRKAVEDFNAEIVAVSKQAAAELADVMGMQKINQTNRDIDQNENDNSERKRSIRYDYSIDASENVENNKKVLEEQKKFHKEMLDEEKKFIDERKRLQLQESVQNMDNLLAEEERRYQQQIEANDKAQREKWEQVYEMAQQGIVSEKEAQEMQQQVALEYQTAAADMLEAHNRKMAEIRKNGEQEQKNIIEQSLQERQQMQAEENSKMIGSIQEMYDEIGYISEQEQKKNVNRTTGLFNIQSEKKRLQEVLKAYEDTLSELDKQYEELKRQLNDGEIDFDQFTEGKKQIDGLKKQAEQSAEDTQNSLKDLFQTWAGSINDFAQKITSEFQNLYGTFNEIMSLKYDMEEEALDREQEQLDKESEMVENAYDKQAEIVQRYKDAINETEDELKTARGERRLALIDGLAQQREAYLQETDSLKKQQIEKEKIAKKEEQLQKKQDALEKKRKQQQKQQSIINAIVNTALGVTQALSAYPPPTSWILASAVSALGAVQIATISSQKYAQGGIIEGKSHKDGGVKVLGGRAEVEGGEMIVNKKTTTMNTDMLYFINGIRRRITEEDMKEFFNSKGKVSISPRHSLRYSQGGELPELTDYNLKQTINEQQQLPEIRVVAQITDISNALDNYNQIKVLAGLADSSYQR